MTLQATKVVTLSGNSTFDGIQAQRYSATIDITNPSTTNISAYMGDQKAYDNNRADVRKDFSAFQELVWAEEDRMLSESVGDGKTATPTTDDDGKTTPAEEA